MLICSSIIPSRVTEARKGRRRGCDVFVLMDDREAIGKKEASLSKKIWLAGVSKAA
jgi:hypothetical protein